MRLTYVDDSGMFNSAQEPFIVVGAAIIHADKELSQVEECLDSLVRKYIPADDREDFTFHATELWSGGKYFDRQQWPRKKRSQILMDLVQIPRKLNIPLTFGYSDRQLPQSLVEKEDGTSINDREREQMLHGIALTMMCCTVEEFMRDLDDEITILLMEWNDAVVHTTRELIATAKKFHVNDDPFPFRKIKETVLFAKKHESPCLQLADICTFFVKKRLVRDSYARPFYAYLKPQLLVLPKHKVL